MLDAIFIGNYPKNDAMKLFRVLLKTGDEVIPYRFPANDYFKENKLYKITVVAMNKNKIQSIAPKL